MLKTPNNYQDSHHSQVVMKFATQMSPLLNFHEKNDQERKIAFQMMNPVNECTK
jgi:hypothetical protein